jgi:hypothetical protein
MDLEEELKRALAEVEEGKRKAAQYLAPAVIGKTVLALIEKGVSITPESLIATLAAKDAQDPRYAAAQAAIRAAQPKTPPQ